jgi:hypothetical protein
MLNPDHKTGKENRMTEYPYTPVPQDLTRLLTLLPTIEIPADKADVAFMKSLGFTLSSAKHLHSILKSLGFIDENNKPTGVWKDYLVEEKRGRVLASGIKRVYPGLFERFLSPYLEQDDTLCEYFKQISPGTSRELGFKLDTFRVLSELADFQDVLAESGFNGLLPETGGKKKELQVKVDPNPQVTIQVHIDPATPDDKIETIFKNMRKYLLGKED